MKILWFAGNPALFASASYNGGGWIGALQHELIRRNDKNVELSIAFPWAENIKIEKDGVIYYGIKKLKRAFFHYNKKERQQLQRMKEIINDYQPDVIQVFGTEAIYGLVSSITNIPVVIHIQGILCAIFQSWLPQNLSWTDYLISCPRMFLGYKGQEKLIKRELKMFQNCRYFMGRTIWDKNIINFISPKAQYFYCGEMLRSAIYNSSDTWHWHNKDKKTIISVISNAVYKGADVILRTARILFEHSDIDFEWLVYGINDLKFQEKHTKIKAVDVNVFPKGIVTAEVICRAICEADIFVHPSYIENSPNTICEAQVLGIPIIATHVGGCESIVEHNKTGIIVPANDTYMLAAQINNLSKDKSKCLYLSAIERQDALNRHNPQSIINDLLSVYKTISNEKI